MILALTSVAAAGVLRHAVIVGANEGGGTLEPLRYAELDAQRVADTLTEIGGFDPAYVDVLYAPSAQELRDYIHAHANVAKGFDEDLFFFYYSGHADARGLRLGSELYNFESLRSDIRAMPAEVKLGVLDACRSGTITRLKGAALSQPFLVEDRLAAEGEAWMTSASADEAAQESDRLRGSFFTHYLLSGLRGAADGGDGEVTLDEAYRYAYDRVVDHTGGTAAGAQHPLMDQQIKQQGALPITRVTEGRATVTLPEELEGDVAVIRMPDRTPVAEVAKKSGRAVTLALTPGTYKFRLTQGRELKEATVGVSDGGRLVLSRWGAVNAELASSKGAGFALDALELARNTSREGVSWAGDALHKEDLRHSPLLAGGMSVITPGAGQFYNGQGGKGVLLGLSTFAALGLSTIPQGAVLDGERFFQGSVVGPNPMRMTAAMLYGIAIADAAYHAQHREGFRPVTGLAFSTSTLWTTRADDPHNFVVPFTAGLNAEWIPMRGVSFAADRVGWTGVPGVESTWSLGGRMQFSIEGTHLRPGAFLAMGGRLAYKEGDEPTAALIFGGGAQLRWYVTPRYFVEHELRVENDPVGQEPVVAYGGGLGVHFGKAASR
ncbi:MAG: caspase family protein [Myxococcota bacterium]